MPTYEYRCRACGHEFEKFQKMTEDPVRRCPECGEDAAERLISPGGGLVFKGPGFYATDYRDPPKKTRGASGDGSGSDAEGSGGSGEAAKEASDAGDG